MAISIVSLALSTIGVGHSKEVGLVPPTLTGSYSGSTFQHDHSNEVILGSVLQVSTIGVGHSKEVPTYPITQFWS